MHTERDREPRQIEQAKEHDDSLPAPVAPGEDQSRQDNGCGWNPKSWINLQLSESKRDRGKLGDESQEVQQQEIRERKTAPPLPKSPVDHRGVTLTRYNPEPHDHFLDKIGDREQQHEKPQKMRPVLSASLHVSRNSARIVVGFHDDQTWSENHQECKRAGDPDVGNANVLGGRRRSCFLPGRMIHGHHCGFTRPLGGAPSTRTRLAYLRAMRSGSTESLALCKRNDGSVISERARIAEGYRIRGGIPSETEAPLSRYRSAVRARDYYRRQTTWASFLLECGFDQSGLP